MQESKSSSPKRSKLGLLLGLGISAGIIVVFIYALDWQKFAAELSKVNTPYLLLYAAVFLLTFWIRALRWRFLLPSDKDLSIRYLFDSFSVGMLGTFILPFRAGEFIRAWSLSRWQGVPFGLGLASIVTERVFDVLALLFLLWLCLLEVENPPAQVTSAALVLGVGAGGILVVMVLCYFCAERMLSFGETVLRVLLGERKPKLQASLLSLARDIIDGFRAISSFGELLLVLVLSLVIWLLFALTMQIGLWSFGEFPSFWVGLTTNSIVALAVAVPSAPGFIGTYQAGCWLSLSLVFGYPKEFSIAYAVVIHAVQALLVFTVGLFCLQRNGLALGDLRRSNEQGNLT